VRKIKRRRQGRLVERKEHQERSENKKKEIRIATSKTEEVQKKKGDKQMNRTDDWRKKEPVNKMESYTQIGDRTV